MNTKLTDQELLTELKRRFDQNAVMLSEQKNLITQLNEVNEKLLASEKLKSNFLSNIRNEINNPIAAVLELSKNITEGNMDATSMQKFAKLIYSEAFDLDFQLRNIFLSAEIEAGEAPLSVISVNISSLLKNCLDSFKTKIDKKEIKTRFINHIDDDQIFKTDSEKLHLIFSNVIGNAIQFNDNGGSVTVESWLEDNMLKVEVSDSGIGINEENVSKIYDRFHQIEEGSTKTYGGHGLGLSITKALLEILNGSITVESTLGKGSKFTILVNQMEAAEGDDDTFSSDGNDFLFDQDEDDMLF
jgi:signal transduction histidine kinase